MSQASKVGLDLMFCYSCYILSFDYSTTNISFFRHIICMGMEIYDFRERWSYAGNLFFSFHVPQISKSLCSFAAERCNSQLSLSVSKRESGANPELYP